MTTPKLSRRFMTLNLVSAALILSMVAPSVAQEPKPASAPDQVDKPWRLPSDGPATADPTGLPSDEDILKKLDGENSKTPFSGYWATAGGVASYLSAVSVVFSVVQQYPALKNVEGTLSRYQRLKTPGDLQAEITKLEGEKTRLESVIKFAGNPVNPPPGLVDNVPVLNTMTGKKAAKGAAKKLAEDQIKLAKVTRELEALNKELHGGITLFVKEDLKVALDLKATAAARGESVSVVVSPELKSTLVSEAKLALRTLRRERLYEALRSWNPFSKVWRAKTTTSTETAGLETEDVTAIELVEAGGQKILWSVRAVGVGLRLAVVYEGLKIVYDWTDEQPLPKLKSGSRAAAPVGTKP